MEKNNHSFQTVGNEHLGLILAFPSSVAVCSGDFELNDIYSSMGSFSSIPPQIL